MADKREKKRLPIYFNMAEFNRGQSSKRFKEVVEKEATAIVQKNGKPFAVVISYERYKDLYEKGEDI